MRGYFIFQILFGSPRLFFDPEIANRICSFQLNLFLVNFEREINHFPLLQHNCCQSFPTQFNIHLVVESIEKTDGYVAFLQRFKENFKFAVIFDFEPLFSQRILIDGNQTRIHQGFFGYLIHVLQVVSGKKRSRQHTPQTEMCPTFALGQSTIANNENIWIVPMVWSRIYLQSLLYVEVDYYTTIPVFFHFGIRNIPIVLNVAGSSS